MSLLYPENVDPASKILKEELLHAAAQFTTIHTVELKPRPNPDNPIIKETTIGLEVNPPVFITSRLPAIERKGSLPPEVEYFLIAEDTRPARLPDSSIMFAGRISIVRYLKLPLQEIYHRWSVHYDIYSPRRRITRTVLGELVEIKPSCDEIVLSELPEQEQVSAAFPKHFAVTEAWQLKELLEHPRPTYEQSPPFSINFL